MNILTQDKVLTMSSREIAKLLNKNHSDIKRSAERLLKLNAINNGQPLAEGKFKTTNGNTFTEYLITKRDSLILVAQNCPAFTAVIVDRWQELESKQAFQIPQTLGEALQLAANQAKQLELQAPKVAFVDNLVDRKNLMTASQVGQKHKVSAVKLNRLLDELGGVYNKGVKRGRVFIQSFVDNGYGEMKQTEMGYSQALFTPAGELYIHEKLISEGVI